MFVTIGWVIGVCIGHLCDIPGLFKKIDELIIRIANLAIHHMKSQKWTLTSHGDGVCKHEKKTSQTPVISN